MKKRIILSLLLFVAFIFFATLFYKSLCIILLFALWRKRLSDYIPERFRKRTIVSAWVCLAILTFVALPKFNPYSSDRVRLLYVDKSGDVCFPPVSHWLLSTIFPEAEVVNVAIHSVNVTSSLAQKTGLMKISDNLIRQANDDVENGKIGNFLSPYKVLGLDNPISGIYPQLSNQLLNSDYVSYYLTTPSSFDPDKSYPLIVFCHGYLGNWQLYQGVLKDFDDAIVISIGTSDLSGIFSQKDIDRIFRFYIPSVEHQGYHVDHKNIHLMGISNGGSAISSAMSSPHAKDFKSLTIISANLTSPRQVPCRVNFIGGGKDSSASRQQSQHRSLRSMSVDSDIFFTPSENHYIFVNQRQDIISFLKKRLSLR